MTEEEVVKYFAQRGELELEFEFEIESASEDDEEWDEGDEDEAETPVYDIQTNLTDLQLENAFEKYNIGYLLTHEICEVIYRYCQTHNVTFQYPIVKRNYKVESKFSTYGLSSDVANYLLGDAHHRRSTAYDDEVAFNEYIADTGIYASVRLTRKIDMFDDEQRRKYIRKQKKNAKQFGQLRDLCTTLQETEERHVFSHNIV